MHMNSPVFQLFLMKKRKLPLGSIGTVVLERQPAFHDYSSRLIQPERDTLRFLPNTENGLLTEFEEFAGGYGLGKQAIEEWIESLESKLNKDNKAELEGIGILKIENNSYIFDTEDHLESYYSPINVEAVIHAGSVHNVKVGEDVRTSEEMKVMLTSKKSKDYWWVYALLLVIVAIAALFYYIYGDQMK